MYIHVVQQRICFIFYRAWIYPQLLKYLVCHILVGVYTEYGIQSIWFRFYHLSLLSRTLFCLFFCLYVTICFSPSTFHLKIRFETYTQAVNLCSIDQTMPIGTICAITFCVFDFFSIEFCTHKHILKLPYFSYSNVNYSSTLFWP